MSTLQSPGPGVVRTIDGGYTPPTIVNPEAARLDAEVEQLRQDRREAAKVEYAEKIRQGEISVEDRERFNREFGLTGETIMAHRRALRESEKCEKILAEPDPDLVALEATAKESNAVAVEALAESIADFFRNKPIETVARAREQIRANCPWLFPHPGIPFDLMPKLPDRQCEELAAEAAKAKSAIELARNRKADAAEILRRVQAGNPILWPAK